MSDLAQRLAAWGERAVAAAAEASLRPRREDVGTVEQVGDGVATLLGLPKARQDELLLLPGGATAMAVTLEPARIGAVLLSPWTGIASGTRVRGTGAVVRVPVGEALLGRVIDPLGRPLDDGPSLAGAPTEPADRPAPGIVDRDLVTVPLATGITVIDAMLPIGRGQRELIIGDRKTGKTALACDAIINQRDSGVVCVYAAIGQKAASVNRLIDAVARDGPRDRTVFVIGAADAPPGLIWLAPYAACTIAEWFRDRGQDALLVLDDLSKHAAVHRQLSLLLRRPPGREAYPGDIFYLHSRLLERGARLARELGGGSLSILPIAETQAGNLSAYIPTNLISITDGQIILEPKLFHEGQKPAVNVGRSVSRVGGRAQASALKGLAASLRLAYAQFLELEVFTRFSGMVDDSTRRTIRHGRRIRALLVQPQGRPRRLAEQVAGLLALQEELLEDLPPAALDRFKNDLGERLGEACPDIVERIAGTATMDEADRDALLAWLRGFVAELAGLPERG